MKKEQLSVLSDCNSDLDDEKEESENPLGDDFSCC